MRLLLANRTIFYKPRAGRKVSPSQIGVKDSRWISVAIQSLTLLSVHARGDRICCRRQSKGEAYWAQLKQSLASGFKPESSLLAKI